MNLVDKNIKKKEKKKKKKIITIINLVDFRAVNNPQFCFGKLSG